MINFVMGDWMGFGIIGIVYEGFANYIISHIIFFVLAALCLVGLVSTIKWIFTRKRKKETPGEKWMRTGKL